MHETKSLGIKNIDDLKSILKDHLKNFELSSSDGPFSVEHDCELSPRDYLKFAEEELHKHNSVSLINCVSHLKRALDCQIDIFCHVFNLRKIFKKNNLGVQRKLEFISAVGFLNLRSLSRLNAIRNKMEHDYAVPDIKDIEVYFDLITAVVYLLESGCFESSSLEFYFDYEHEFYKGYILNVEYVKEFPEIVFTLGDIIDLPKYPEDLNIDIFNDFPENQVWSVKATDDIDEFAYCFKVLRLLNLFWIRQQGYEYILRELELF